MNSRGNAIAWAIVALAGFVIILTILPALKMTLLDILNAIFR